MTTDRRSRRVMRELTETILLRCTALEETDRILVEQVVGRGVKPREVAAMSGASVRSVQRRLRGLVQRLLDSEVVYVLRHRQHWTRSRANVATVIWVQGHSMQKACEKLSMPLQEVRDHAQAVRGLIAEGERSLRRRRMERERRGMAGTAA